MTTGSVGGVFAKARGQFARDVGTSLASSIATVVAAAIQAVVVAKAFGPAGKGIVTLTFLLPGVVGPLVGSGFNASLTYFASRAPLRSSSLHLTSFGIAASVVSFVVVIALGITGGLHALAPDLHGAYLVVACLAIPLTIFTGALGALLQGLGRIRQVNVVRVYQSLSSAALVAAACALSDSPVTVVAAMVATLAGGVVVLVRLLYADGGALALGIDSSVLRDQFRYAAKDHLGAVLQFLNYRLDQVFVTAYLSTTQLGLYSIAVTVGEALWIVPGAVADVVFPRAARQRKGEGVRSTMISFVLALGISFVGGLGLFSIGGVLIDALFGAKFHGSYDALVWLLPGAVLLGPTKILTNDLAGRGYPLVNSACAGLGLAVTVVLDVVLIPRHGIRGAAAASSAAYVVVSLLGVASFLVLRRRPSSSYAA